LILATRGGGVDGGKGEVEKVTFHARVGGGAQSKEGRGRGETWG